MKSRKDHVAENMGQVTPDIQIIPEHGEARRVSAAHAVTQDTTKQQALNALKQIQGLSVIGLCVIIVGMAMVTGGVYYAVQFRNTTEKIPTVIAESHALEAATNADKIFNFVKAWEEKNPHPKHFVTFYGKGRKHQGRTILQRIEGAPDVGCTKYDSASCKSNLFTYQAGCSPLDPPCSIAVEPHDDSFYLYINYFSENGKKLCVPGEDEKKGIEICNYLTKQGWELYKIPKA